MTGHVIVRHQTILNHDEASSLQHLIRFAALDDDDPGRTTTLYLPDDLWREMGSPETVTVAVRPGDYLNNEIEQAE